MKEILHPFKKFLNEATKVPPMPSLRAPDPMADGPIKNRKTMRIDQMPGESDEETLALADQTFIRMLKSDNPESPFSKLPDLSKKQLGLFYDRLVQRSQEAKPKENAKIKAGLLAFKKALGTADTINEPGSENTMQDFSPSEKGRVTQPQGSKTLNRAPVYADTLDMKEVIEEANKLIDSLINE